MRRVAAMRRIVRPLCTGRSGRFASADRVGREPKAGLAVQVAPALALYANTGYAFTRTMLGARYSPARAAASCRGRRAWKSAPGTPGRAERSPPPGGGWIWKASSSTSATKARRNRAAVPGESASTSQPGLGCCPGFSSTPISPSPLVGRWAFSRVELVAAVDNLLDVSWNEAQFATTSRLQDEPSPLTELHFTPGAGRSLQVGVRYDF
jgi:outer membrane receptor protein involved in Fe transport